MVTESLGSLGQGWAYCLVIRNLAKTEPGRLIKMVTAGKKNIATHHIVAAMNGHMKESSKLLRKEANPSGFDRRVTMFKRNNEDRPVPDNLLEGTTLAEEWNTAKKAVEDVLPDRPLKTILVLFP